MMKSRSPHSKPRGDRGINFFDTALAYGNGHSEQLIGRAFGKSNEVIIASKVPPLNEVWPARNGTPLREVFPREYVLKSLEQVTGQPRTRQRRAMSIKFHVWNDEWVRMMKKFLAEMTVSEMEVFWKKVRAVGLSINDHQPENSMKALASGLIDSVQVIYNVFDQSPEDKLFPYCRMNGVGVIARVPFDEGSLYRKHPSRHGLCANRLPQCVFQRQSQTGSLGPREQNPCRHKSTSVEDLPSVSLRFCISDPTVSTVIPGMRSPAVGVTANTVLFPMPVRCLQRYCKSCARTAG